MARTPSIMDALGTQMPEFKLEAPDGSSLSNYPMHEVGTLVMFLSNHCPFVIHLKTHLAKLTQKYGSEISIYGIMSNDVDAYPDDAPHLMQKDAEIHGYAFPYLFDPTQEVAKAFRAACTPDFFLYNGTGKLVYRGQYDSSRPGNEVPVTGSDLEKALVALISNEDVDNQQRPSLGCNIKWQPGNAPDYFSA